MHDLTADAYASLRATARKHSRVASEADDLLQDALCVAVEQGRLDLLGDDGPWLRGVMAHLALRRARDAVRRRGRELTHERPGATPPAPLPNAAFLRGLPPSARAVATLAINGMLPAEIRHVLGLSDAAYRQRLTTIRRAAREAGGVTGEIDIGDPALDFGVIRQALLDAARRRGHVASHDPDGNLFLIGEISPSQDAAPRQPTGEAADGAAPSPS